MALPRLSAQQPIVNPDRKPSSPFLQFMEKTRTTQEATDARQDASDDALATVQETQGEEIARLNAALAQIQALLGLTQQAQQAANTAQETADDALGAGTVSGYATNPSIDLLSGGWVAGPQIDLTGVVAGTLTISGTGPQQDGDVAVSGSDGSMACEFRVVEVVGGVDTVLGTFTFSADLFTGASYITNTSGSAVAAFSAPRSTTGAVSYRIDAQKLGSNIVSSLLLYIYARRTP